MPSYSVKKQKKSFNASDYMIARTNHQDAWIFGHDNFSADRQTDDRQHGGTEPITLSVAHVPVVKCMGG